MEIPRHGLLSTNASPEKLTLCPSGLALQLFVYVAEDSYDPQTRNSCKSSVARQHVLCASLVLHDIFLLPLSL